MKRIVRIFIMISQKGYTFEKITYKIIGLAMQVHNNLGPGFEEKFYQRALAKELLINNIKFGREQWLPVYYKKEKIGKKRVDFLIENVILEIKAKAKFDEQDYIQTLSYLKATEYRIALLINFGSKSIETKRFIDSQDKYFK